VTSNPMAKGLRLHLLQVVSSGLKKGRKMSVKGLPGIKKLPGSDLPGMSQTLMAGFKSQAGGSKMKGFSSI